MDDATQALVKRLADELELEAKEDWVGLWEVVSSLEELSLDEATLRERTLKVVRALLDRGLIAGDSIYSVHPFRPWPDQRPEAIISGYARSGWRWDEFRTSATSSTLICQRDQLGNPINRALPTIRLAQLALNTVKIRNTNQVSRELPQRLCLLRMRLQLLEAKRSIPGYPTIPT